MSHYDEEILMEVGDGPEGIKMYLSEDKAIVDWSTTIPALYVEVALNGAAVQLGPFQLLGKLLKERLKC